MTICFQGGEIAAIQPEFQSTNGLIHGWRLTAILQLSFLHILTQCLSASPAWKVRRHFPDSAQQIGKS